MSESIIISFANQKGGVGKTTLCTLFANYLADKFTTEDGSVSRGILVIDCDKQKTVSMKRSIDQEKYKGTNFKYNVQSVNIAEVEKIQLLVKGLRQMSGIILIDAPGNLTQQGLIPILANSDYIVCPFQYESTSIASTLTFVAFVRNLQKSLGERMKTKLIFSVNRLDKRFGKKEEIQLWNSTEEKMSKFGLFLPKVEYRADMTRYNTVSLSDSQKEILSPAFDVLYEETITNKE